MNLDLTSILKGEISKKQKELAYSKGAQQPCNEKSQAQESANIDEIPREIEQESTNEKNLPDNQPDEDIGATISKLENRPDRIQQAIAQDNTTSVIIDPSQIGSTEGKSLLSMKCNLYIHEILSRWKASLDEYHPELFLDTKKALFPLLLQLRRGQLASDLLISLATVLYHLQQPKEINLAVQSYMKLSIGNVAWPIGVTSVGIHARSAHSKIQGGRNAANIMIDERTRLWITSIKRLITFEEWYASNRHSLE
ncbi:mRNA splicing protein PRP18 [Saccharomyces paradoxus]|uniref:Pre-mRNA-splicing factor 18 n=1 Tax=Saccharomyces paradoxus TaxID=27291 RepID=A0A8B8URE9_SACPA|nr:Prp18 [Saccharomyces paradoxus]QHS73328.1 Prp18 [Saccharomyces paradoxus]